MMLVLITFFEILFSIFLYIAYTNQYLKYNKALLSLIYIYIAISGQTAGQHWGKICEGTHGTLEGDVGKTRSFFLL